MMTMIMRKVVGLFFFSSESHPEHMSHPAYQKLPPLCLCLVEIREKRKQMQKKPQLVFVCFYLPVLLFFGVFCVLENCISKFILCVRSHVTLRTGQNMCVHLQAAFSLS